MAMTKGHAIVQTAMFIVRQAQEEILATMDLAEEIKHPLPKGYFLLLTKKLNEGVRFKRLAFGTARDFNVFRSRHEVGHKNYVCKLVAKRGYRRMLLIDRKKVMFAIGSGKTRKFFYSEDPLVARKYQKYFSRKFKLATISR